MKTFIPCCPSFLQTKHFPSRPKLDWLWLLDCLARNVWCLSLAFPSPSLPQRSLVRPLAQQLGLATYWWGYSWILYALTGSGCWCVSLCMLLRSGSILLRFEIWYKEYRWMIWWVLLWHLWHWEYVKIHLVLSSVYERKLARYHYERRLPRDFHLVGKEPSS